MPRHPYQRQRLAFNALIALLGCALVVVLALTYRMETARAVNYLDISSTLAEKQLEQQLREADTVLAMLGQSAERYLTGRIPLSTLETRAEGLHTLVGSVDNFSVLNSSGDAIAASLSFVTGQNFSYREYFTRARDADDESTLILSAPFLSLANDVIFTLSRKVNDPWSQFTGVVVASLNTSRLHDMMKLQLREESKGVRFVVLHGSGSQLLSVPALPENAPSNLGLTENSPVTEHLTSASSRTLADGHLYPGADAALFDIRTVAPAGLQLSDPLVVLTLFDKQAAYAEWHWLALALCSAYGAIVAAGILYLRKERRYFRKEMKIRQELKTERQRLTSIIEGTNVGTWEWNVQTGETTYNERWAEILGYSLAELQPVSIKTWQAHTHPDDLEESGRRLQQHFNGESPYYELEVRMRHRDGHWVWVLDRGKVASWSENGEPLKMFGTHQEITERKQAEARTSYLAYTDALTSLPNRRLLDERLHTAIRQAERYNRSLAVMFLDLDNFKAVNDSLGHDAGDTLLVETAERLSHCVRRSDTVARTGGDEFVILLSEISVPEGAYEVAEKILASMRRPFMLSGQAFVTPPSIGIALYPEHAENAAMLINRADQAMYRAKRAGRNCIRLYVGEEVTET